MDKTEVLICSCYSPEHQWLLSVDEENGEKTGYIHPHLIKKSFWYRLKYGVKYIFGYKCRYGAWDEIIVDKGNVQVLENFVNEIKK